MTQSVHSFSRLIRLRISLLVIFLAAFSSEIVQSQGVAPWVGQTISGIPCKGDGQGYGPFDYLNRYGLAQELAIVEKHHFTPEVERLSIGNVVSNIDYTLRAWPNHHRALNTMMRYQSREKVVSVTQFRTGIPYVECYLYRAINYSPNDATARMLLAMHLQSKKKLDLAYEQYEVALSKAPRDLQIQYNFALLLVKMKKYPQARKYAEQIYLAGFPLTGLRRQLEEVGEWP